MSSSFSKKLSNNKKIPILGLGTYQGFSNPSNVEQAVKVAIDAGYRLFDCAPTYGNQKLVGKALKEKIEEKVVKRKDLFIVTKLWNTDHRENVVEDYLKSSLKELNLEYVDLFLMNWPFSHTNDIHFTETWRGMEKCFNNNLTKGIGLSNFNSEQIEEILEIAKVKPVVNQVECHINMSQARLRDFCKEKNIAIMGYSPFGDPNSPIDGPYASWKSSERVVLDTPIIKNLCEKYKKNEYQIALRYLTQLGVIAIPRSSSAEHIAENMNIFDFQFRPAEITEIELLDSERRIWTASQFDQYKHYPFDADF